MSGLADLLGTIFSETVASSGPSSDRGRVIVWLGVGIALLAATSWLLATTSKPLQEPSWGFGALAGAFSLSPVFAVLCAVHARREPNDRHLGVLGALANAGATVAGTLALL